MILNFFPESIHKIGAYIRKITLHLFDVDVINNGVFLFQVVPVSPAW